MVVNRGSGDEPSVTFDLSEVGISCLNHKVYDVWAGEVNTSSAGHISVQDTIPSHGSTVLVIEGDSGCKYVGGSDIDHNKFRIPSFVVILAGIFLLTKMLKAAVAGRAIKTKED